MPDTAALVRNLCMALEAWPQEVPTPVPFKTPADVHQLSLGLQTAVHSSLYFALHAQQLLLQPLTLASGPCTGATVQV